MLVFGDWVDRPGVSEWRVWCPGMSELVPMCEKEEAFLRLYAAVLAGEGPPSRMSE